jgi:hypothetical protein
MHRSAKAGRQHMEDDQMQLAAVDAYGAADGTSNSGFGT